MTVTLLNPPIPKHNLLLKDIPFNSAFTAKNLAGVRIKIKPVNYLTNSTLINDMIHKQNCLVYSPASGTCFIMDGDKEVKLHDLTITNNGFITEKEK